MRFHPGMGPIPGVSKTSLWKTWKAVRPDLRHSAIRDVVDYLDYDVDPDKWIGVLLSQLETGRYEPGDPIRFTLGKSLGFSRTMTLPSIPDLVLYRAIVDFIYRKVRGREHEHVYFRRPQLQAAQRKAQDEARDDMRQTVRYGTSSQVSFQNWLKYDQYRKHLLLKRAYPVLVITDVSNFFDSVLHSHVDESLRGLPLPPRLIGLLFFLLERLSIRQDYAGTHRISLPVDEFDCSRTLAHIVLFPHDHNVVKLVGEDAYVRWMDDQNIGVQSRGEGLRLLAEIGRSLGRLHLTPNPKKSRILSLSEARRHFHLDTNKLLDEADDFWKTRGTASKRKQLARMTRAIWAKAKLVDGEGEFKKVLARLYRLAGTARARFLRRRAHTDLLRTPELAARICDYMRCSGTSAEYLRFIEQILQSEEQVYPDVNVVIFESLLRIETKGRNAKRIRNLATQALTRKLQFVGKTQYAAVAPLLILRFGDRRSIPLLKRVLLENTGRFEPHVIRSLGLAISSYGRVEFQFIRKIASRLLRNHLASVVLLIERILEYDRVPDRFISRLTPRFDAVQSQTYLDTRTLLTARLLSLSKHSAVSDWVKEWKKRTSGAKITTYDRAMLKKKVSL